MAVVLFAATAPAHANTRSLKLYFIHTKERAEITYKRNGRYDQKGLDQINRFLRDWRRNEPGRMDPQLLDLLWEVYRSVGARDYIHVVSAYRSPATNSMLRNRSSGVAQNSQHTHGRAIDFYIPGVPLSRLRAAGFKAEGGGVGFYPNSGSPFVHLDTGNVRSWPRMSRSELMALFPDGRTIHLPNDGKPLPGYQQALAAYEARKRSGGSVQIASASSGTSSSSSRSSAGNSGGGGGGGLLATLFSGGQGGGQATSQRGAPTPAAAVPAPAAAAPAPAASAPAAAPAPEPQTPEAIIAALPPRAVPLPAAAPRPPVDVGAQPAQPLVPGLPGAEEEQAQPVPQAEEPAAPPAAEDIAVAANVPIPTSRPDYAPAAVAEEAAAVQVAAVEEAAPLPDLPVNAIIPERARDGGSEAIAELLAQTAAEARADVVVNPPVPELRPRLSAETAGERQVASVAPDAGSGDVFALASLPNTDMAVSGALSGAAPRVDNRPGGEIPAFEQDERAAALAASPRVAMLSREPGGTAAEALESGVRTTAKAAKPKADQARRETRPMVVPVQHGLTRWAFRRDVTVASAGGTSEPARAHAMVLSAPQTVYTDGFQQGAPQSDANRFTGNAVKFLSVARFGSN